MRTGVVMVVHGAAAANGPSAAVPEQALKDCGYGCGMRVVWAPVAATGRPRTFNPEWCDLAPDVWVLRRGQGMVPCSALTDQQLAALRGQGVRGWRPHTCSAYEPTIKSFDLPGKLEQW